MGQASEAAVRGHNPSFHLRSRLPATFLSLSFFAFTGFPFAEPAFAVGGSVFAWGYNSFGECNVPGGLTTAVEVACGNYFSMALRADGSIATWGDNAFGLRNVPATASNVIAVSTRGYDCLALLRDGSLVIWGDNTYGQWSIPSGATGIVAIATGGGHHLALREDGELLTWGANNHGQCNIPLEATNVVAIAAGYTHSLVLRKDGRVIAWGENLGGTTSIPIEATNIVAISCGPHFNLALRADRRVVAWGLDWGGNLNVPDSATNVVTVAAGEMPEFVVRSDGSVLAWGRNDNGELNVPPGLFPAFSIGAGNYHSLGIRVVGGVSLLRQPTNRVVSAGDSILFNIPAIGQTPVSYQWRFGGEAMSGETSPVLLLPGVQSTNAGSYDLVVQNGYGAVTSQVASLTVLPAAPTVTLHPTGRVGSIGGNASFSVRAKGTLPLHFQWQLNGTNLVGETNATLSLEDVGPGNGGSYRVVVTNGLGQIHSSEAPLEVVPVFAWGDNASGVLDLPFGLTNVIALAAGQSHNLALKADGKVIGWGDNSYNESMALGSESNWVAVAAGDRFSLGLRTTGTVVAYGDVIVAPADATNVAAIAAGPGYSLLIKSNGTLFAWGWANTPVPPATATNIIAVAAGRWHSLGIRADGVVLGWGNSNYELANPPASATNVIDVAAGDEFNVCLRADGTVFAWGNNASGQTNIPPDATNIVSISAGGSHALAMREDGRIFVWGDTNSGQGEVPVALTFPSAIAAGNRHDLALLGAGELRFARQPSSRSVIAGSRTALSGSAIGQGPVTYQWMHEGTNVPGATHAYFTIADSQVHYGGSYAIVISNRFGSITSAVANVTVVPSAPIIVQQPSSRLALPSESIAFTVSAIGTAPLSYQWKFDSADISGATNAALVLTNVQLVNRGDYQVIVSNSLGMATSAVARLEIHPFNLLAAITNAAGNWSVDWGDYDNDGRLDLLVGGKAGGQAVTATARLFRNEGNGNFAETNINFGLNAQSVAWGDFDNDGFLDALLSGTTSARISRNNGDGTFTNLAQALAADSSTLGSVVDFNRDGRLDISLGGRLYRNLGGNLFTNVTAGLPTTQFSTTAWGDYDGDGLPDVLICGLVGGSAQFRLFRNIGNGTFTNVPAGFQDIYRGQGAWLDFDADGRLDVAVSGQTGPGVRFAALYRNNGDGSFYSVTSGLPAMSYAWVTTGDADNDGKPDLFLSGDHGAGNSGRLFRGLTNGTFSQVAAPFPTNLAPFAAWGDYDADGRLDLALSTTVSGQTRIGVYRNDATLSNTPPMPPASTAAAAGPNRIHFQWSTTGSDAQTPVPSLTYALRVGKSSGAGDVLSADAATNGMRRVARAGNAGPLRSLTLTNLALGKYYWAVQTLDSAFAGSPFTAEQIYIYAAATLPPTNVTSSEAILIGVLDTDRLPALAWFEWGATTNLGNVSVIQSFPTNADSGFTGAAIAGLLPGTTYYCRLVVSNADGIHSGGQQTFITTDLPQIVPLAASDITASNATLSALVNPKGSTTSVSFEYGLSRSYGNSTSFTNIGSGRSVAAVARKIGGLVGGQVYHFRILATNDVGSAYSADATFVTSTEPEAATLAATGIAATSVTLNALVRPNSLPTQVFFEYGATTNLGSVTVTTNLPGITNLLAVGIPAGNLARLTTFYFRVAATNGSGITRGRMLNFKTTNDVIALPPTEIAMAAATLNGLVNPNGVPTSMVFEYGLTTNLGNVTPEIVLSAGTNLTAVSRPIVGLLSDTTYYFRVVATNADGLRASTTLAFQTLPLFSVVNPSLSGIANGAAAWGDYDNDGKQDLLMVSQTLTRLYRNLGNGSFTQAATSIVGASSGSVAWGDYNNDGWLDVLVVGTGTGGPLSRIYRNNGNGTFADVQAGLQAVGFGMGRWGDFNNDGRPDVFLVGETNGVPFSKVFRNDGNGVFAEMSVGLPAYLDAHGVTLDYDNDGRLDILLMGRVGIPYADVYAKLYRNLGDETFQDSGIALPGVRLGFGEWGDFDGDGWPDLVYGGRNSNLSDALYLFRNTGNGTFSNLTSLVPQFAADAAHWGDYDGDGRPDIMARGQKYYSSVVPSHSYSAALHNNGTHSITYTYLALPEIWSSAGGMCDYDADGRIDLLITGNSRTGNLLRLYRNNWPATNAPPSPPTQQTNSVFGNAISLGWKQGSDAESPPASLGYNLRVGRTPGGGEIVSPLSGSNGFRRVVAPGNLGQATSFTLTNLAPAAYYWSVQTIDAAFTGSPFGTEQVVVVVGAPFATTLPPTNVTSSEARLLGSVTANGSATTSFFQWGVTTNFGQLTLVASLPADFSTNQASTLITNLSSGSIYYYRIAASNIFGITYGQIRQMQTVSPPLLSAARVADNSMQINFAGSVGASYGVYATTNLLDWVFLGQATPIASNLFRFVGQLSNSHPARFYRVSNP